MLHSTFIPSTNKRANVFKKIWSHKKWGIFFQNDVFFFFLNVSKNLWFPLLWRISSSQWFSTFFKLRNITKSYYDLVESKRIQDIKSNSIVKKPCKELSEPIGLSEPRLKNTALCIDESPDVYNRQSKLGRFEISSGRFVSKNYFSMHFWINYVVWLKPI